jgi:hypothetical protein
MDYAGMASKLGQFRQAQVPGGGQRPMNGWGERMGQMPQRAQGAFNGAMNRMQGMMPNGMLPQASGLAGGVLQSQGRPNPYMTNPGVNPIQATRQFKGGMGGGGGSFGGGM